MREGAVEQLYRLHRKELTVYLFALCQNAELAEDLVQETFLKALLCFPHGHTNVRAWLYAVARNLCINYLKKERRQFPLEEAGELPAGGLSLSDRLIREEEIRELLKGLSLLSPEKREILTLYYFSGMPQKDIAGLLNLSPEAVRVQSFRARQELKHFLEVHHEEAG